MAAHELNKGAIRALLEDARPKQVDRSSLVLDCYPDLAEQFSDDPVDLFRSALPARYYQRELDRVGTISSLIQSEQSQGEMERPGFDGGSISGIL